MKDTHATIEQLLRNGMIVQFRRSVSYRVLCEIFFWDGTPLAFATASTITEALAAAMFDLPEIVPDGQKPARRAYEELRKRGIEV